MFSSMGQVWSKKVRSFLNCWHVSAMWMRGCAVAQHPSGCIHDLTPFEKMLFSNDIWNQWVHRVQRGPRSKSYIHFDHPVDFPHNKNRIESLFKTPGKIAQHNFIPLIKVIAKTPRFRYQEDTGEYTLETKERPISFACHLDTYIYSFYSYALSQEYQQYIKSRGFDKCVLAYRTDLDGKCNIQFAKEVFQIIEKRGECTALALDIKGYFDSIDHLLLKQSWSKVLGKPLLDDDEYAIFKSLTKYNYVNQITLLKHFNLKIRGKGTRKPVSYSPLLEGSTLSQKMRKLRNDDLIVTNEMHEQNGDRKRFYGIPQGSALSATLSNIYLVDFDEFMFRLGGDMSFEYRRYCDDIMIICKSTDADFIQQRTIQEINEKYYLTIQPRKVEVIDFKRNSKNIIRAFNRKKIIADNWPTITRTNEQRYYKTLQYLGFEFTGQKILIRSGSVSRYFRKMRARIVKSVAMAYGKKGTSDRVFKEQIFHRYTHLGSQNFLSYAYNASKEMYRTKLGMKEGMNSPAIKKQLARHFNIIFQSLSQKNDKRYHHKLAKGQKVKLKKISVRHTP